MLGEHLFEHGVCGVGPRCSFCGTSTGPFREVEGLFAVQMCGRCFDARHVPATELLAHHDPGEPWWQWGCPLKDCGWRSIGPEELEGHTAAEHPGWTATYELLRPYPDQLQRVVYRRSTAPISERSAPVHSQASPAPAQHGHDGIAHGPEHAQDQAKGEDR